MPQLSSIILVFESITNEYAPLHVTPFGATESEDAVLRKNVQAQRINALLIDDDEVLLLLVASDGLITYQVLELNDLLALCISEPSLRLHQLFSLLGRGVEEPRVDFTTRMLSAPSFRPTAKNVPLTSSHIPD